MAESPKSSFIALVMAGGSGTRFWPLSRSEKPKQYLSLFGSRSLIQSTIDRLKIRTDPSNIFICSGESQKAILKEQLPEISQLILEPSGRNTAPCLMLSVATLLHRGYAPSTVMGVFPADHFIGEETTFSRLVEAAVQEAKESPNLITLGITPTQPHTGYGYIQAAPKTGASSFQVKKFVEKPSLEVATRYLSEGNFFWNAGIFFWKLETIVQSFERFMGEEWNLLSNAVQNGTLQEVYPRITSQPIDVAVLEKAPNVRVIPAAMNWSDVGSWNALLELQQNLTGQKNILISEKKDKITLMESENCLVVSESPQKIVLIGMENIIVVNTEQGLLISQRAQDQKVKLVP